MFDQRDLVGSSVGGHLHPCRNSFREKRFRNDACFVNLDVCRGWPRPLLHRRVGGCDWVATFESLDRVAEWPFKADKNAGPRRDQEKSREDDPDGSCAGLTTGATSSVQFHAIGCAPPTTPYPKPGQQK